MKPLRGILMVLLGSVCALAAPPKRVALVFDDGPRPADAEPLLALLVKEKVKVTFSFVGDRVNESPATAKAIAAAGHEIANHSQSHLHPKDLDDAALGREIALAQEKITAATGQAPRWYWPPFLETDDRVRAAAAHAGLTVYTPKHLVVSMDYDRTVPAAEIYRRATTDVQDGTGDPVPRVAGGDARAVARHPRRVAAAGLRLSDLQRACGHPVNRVSLSP